MITIDSKILAVIPARAGSKRLPGKNVKTFNSRPLVEWSIAAAINSQLITDVCVSTDCDDVSAIAKKFNKVLLHERPPELASDLASSVDVVVEALEATEKVLGKKYDAVMLLQPTSPLRNSKHIDAAIRQGVECGADTVASVCEAECPVEWINKLGENGSMSYFLDHLKAAKRSQDYSPSYRLNGAIYLTTRKSLLACGSLFSVKSCFGYIMDRQHSVDIDDALDFEVAEAIAKLS
ncbi:MAG: hypothetical protein AB8B81_05640 [Halioglobus sp.]